MSVPKPYVHQTLPRRTVTQGDWSITYAADWAWNCECREGRPLRRSLSFAVAVRAAEQHSRTHTAERIAEHLEERMRDELLFAARDPSKEWHLGWAYVCAMAADLIREYLVEAAP